MEKKIVQYYIMCRTAHIKPPFVYYVNLTDSYSVPYRNWNFYPNLPLINNTPTLLNIFTAKLIVEKEIQYDINNSEVSEYIYHILPFIDFSSIQGVI